jgi:lipoate-protein ligase A
VTWPVERVEASAAAIHERPLPEPAERAVWVCEATRPALVLGSAQADDRVDRSACAAAGVDVVRRHSGGGAVLVVPGEVLWVDLVLPAGDPRWEADVGRSFGWVGDAWAAALADLGRAATVHRGPQVRGAWSAHVCFAGLGAGEVTVEGRKVVGLSQRRTRGGARFQCVALARWAPAELVPLLGLPATAVAELEPAAAGLGRDLAPLLDALLRHLP